MQSTELSLSQLIGKGKTTFVVLMLFIASIGLFSTTSVSAQADGCVIPASGPWPACATGGGGGAAPAAPAAPTGGACVIPESGPWPACATDGSGSSAVPATPAGPTAPTLPVNDNLPPKAPVANTNAPRPSAPGAAATNSTVIQVTNDIAVAGAKRLGMNLGGQNQFAAAQLLKNIVTNPGFESSEFTMMIHTLPGASGNRVQSDNWQTNWNNDALQLGHLPGFWNGAQFEVVTGVAKGRSGTVNSFSHDNGRYTFNLNGGGVAPGQDDIVVFRQYNVPGYYQDMNQFNKAEPNDKRPGSPGQQSLRLLPTGNNFSPSWQMGFDSYARDEDPSAGKLLVIEGQWHFEIWAKSKFGGSTLSVSFRRLGEATFFQQDIQLSQGWERYVIDFNVAPGLDGQILGTPQPLTLDMVVTGGEVLVDDVILEQSNQNNPTVFNNSVVQSLREMRPGILRNWGKQSGSSLNNQLSTQFARKLTGSSPKERIGRNYQYSMHEFLQLAQTVGAEPWIVIPPTWSNAELQNFMGYLAAPQGAHPYANIRANLGQAAPWTSVFGEIHLEYGNEVWGANFGNDPFLGQSMRGGERAGQVLNDRYAAVKASPFYNAGKFDLVIGGQSRFPGRQTEIQNNSTNHDSIGFAPYYGELTASGNDRDRYLPLYAHAEELDERGPMVQNQQLLAGSGTDMSIYEINVHTIRNFVPEGVRNDVLSSQGAGISLPLVQLSYMRDMGITDQAVFQLAQFSEPAPGGHARVFGVMRDLEATSFKRPTALGVELANKAIAGNMLVVNQTGSPRFSVPGGNGMEANTTAETIETFAFKAGGRYGIVIFNLDLNNAHGVTLQLPTNPGGAQMHVLSADDIHADNEVNKEVDIFQMPLGLSRQTNLTLAPHSMYVIVFNG